MSQYGLLIYYTLMQKQISNNLLCIFRWCFSISTTCVKLGIHLSCLFNLNNATKNTNEKNFAKELKIEKI